jgi:hypothetical protein
VKSDEYCRKSIFRKLDKSGIFTQGYRDCLTS